MTFSLNRGWGRFVMMQGKFSYLCTTFYGSLSPNNIKVWMLLFSRPASRDIGSPFGFLLFCQILFQYFSGPLLRIPDFLPIQFLFFPSYCLILIVSASRGFGSPSGFKLLNSLMLLATQQLTDSSTSACPRGLFSL